MITKFVRNTIVIYINRFSIIAYWFGVITEDILDALHRFMKFVSTQKSHNKKRQEQNNTEWLDELINQIEDMKNNISKSA